VVRSSGQVVAQGRQPRVPDLGVCYYYTNQPDKALVQFDKSLAIDPKHAKTLLNVGIVRAFKQAGSGRRDQGVGAGHRHRSEQPRRPGCQTPLETLRSAHGGEPKPGA
jgi:hypothetical protein